MASKWVTGPYLGSITVNKVELKYIIELEFIRGGKVTGAGIYDDKPFKAEGTYSETAPFNFKAALHDAFGLKSIFFEGFRGSDDTIFGTWLEFGEVASKKSPHAKKPAPGRNMFNQQHNAGDDDNDDGSGSDEDEEPVTGRGRQAAPKRPTMMESPAQLPGGGRGNFFLKYKKLSPEELEARRKQEAAALATRKEKELAEQLLALQAMGFSKEDSLRALINSGGNVDRALDALFSGGGGGDGPQGGPPAAPAAPAINEALVTQLVDMGFPRERALQALEVTNNNVEAAVELLFAS
jgi:hypothetical protein